MLLTCLLVDKYFFSIRLESSMAYFMGTRFVESGIETFPGNLDGVFYVSA